jgi:hypothetical protein
MKGIHWGWFVLVALVFSVGTYAMFPQVETLVEIETVTVDNTDYNYNDVLVTKVADLESDLVVKAEELVKATTDLEVLRELPQEQFSFGDWILGLLGDAEDDAELTYNGTLYEGEDGEWDLDARDSEDIDARDCDIVFDDKDFGEEMTVECSDIRLETEDDDDIVCDFEITLDNDEYDEAVITNCN